MGGRRWGIASYLAAALLLAGLAACPQAASAAGESFPIRLAAETIMEAQMAGEKPFQAQAPAGLAGSVQMGRDGAKITLPYHLEMGISVRYHQDPAVDASRRPPSSMMFNYSMDYSLLPNLKVGLQGYLFRYDAGESLAFPRGQSDMAMGLGPGLKYDLGRWSFVVKSQVEANRERGEGGLQNWFRVWYAF